MSIENDYTHFYDWIKRNGGQIHDHIKIDIKEERGLFVTDVIDSYTALIVLPWSLVINKDHRDLSHIQTDTERQSLIVFLLEEYAKGNNSKWYHWIKLLNIENEEKTLLNEKLHLYKCVENSTLGEALSVRYQQLQQEYEQLTESNTVDASLELFTAIDHLVWSRILDLPENEPISLTPLIDFANHSLNANARWFIDDKTHDFILRSEQILNPNDEITISYGNKSNEELLYLYGFALPVNPNDRVTIPVNLCPDDDLLEDKLKLIQELKLPPRLTLDIDGILNEESHQLAQILSSKMEIRIDQKTNFYESYLKNLFNEYLEKLKTCSYSNENFIKCYLDGQMMIIKKAIENIK